MRGRIVRSLRRRLPTRVYVGRMGCRGVLFAIDDETVRALLDAGDDEDPHLCGTGGLHAVLDAR